MQYSQDIRHLLSRERVEQLARDWEGARSDGRRARVRREYLRRVLGAAAHRRPGQAQPARR
jgi:hypothetical protein